MINFTIKTNKGKETIHAKDKWEELTFNELLQIETLGDKINSLTLFSILTDKTFDQIANSEDDKLLEVLADATKFVYDVPDWKELKHPKALLIKSKWFDVPSLKHLTFGQKVLLTQLAKNDSMINALPEAVAIVMCNAYYGKFTEDTEKKIPDLIKVIKQCGALEVYSIGQYFFLNYPILTNIGQSFLKKSLPLNQETLVNTLTSTKD